MKPIVIKIFCALLFAPFSVFSQNKLKANISNGEQKAIAFASVALKGTSLGTISNPNGNFELALPSDDTKQQIVISCIGYKSQAFAVDSLLKIQKKGSIPKLYLNKHSYQLQEITVGKQEILKDAKQIFANAINELPKLLDDQPHIGKYYFRQSHRSKTSMNRLIEAAVSIYDPGISHKIEECKFNIDELQSSLDNRDIDFKSLLGFYQYIQKKKDIAKDSLLVNSESYNDPEVQKRLVNALDNNKASFFKFFTATNMIRAAQKERRKNSKPVNPWFVNGGPLLSKTFMKKHRFKLDTIIQYNGEATYKVKILPNKNYLGLEGQEHKFMPIGIAYIRLKDFAIFNLDYGFISNPKYKGFKYRGERHGTFKGNYRYYYLFKIRFKEYNSKFYLNYLYSIRGDYNDDLSGSQKVIQEMVNTEIINDQDIVNQQFQQLNWKGDHYEKLPYHKEFWDNYTTLLPSQEQENLKKNLEQELLKK
ncbi:carboxypeptidase-like regulatory domain-containing protein [Marinifilum sp. D737]|uniref:carboxypeptidase-like regulatory domain-containing protein n=1 Tax=Marinifilum sp. D737 TaxID=2969628 RepID=UPI002276AE69|nr:carboxypeptidase-like regulatory domain-containing protein [Marinifilum sp. D737]MCY1635374.1 carboxypeptidase-like regulatory domain-containing protein [Marinifilum sp. D737]